MKTIIRRELFEQIKTIQFVTLLCLSIILFLFNGFISINKYRQQSNTFNTQRSEIYQKRSTIYTLLLKHPNPLLFISEGGDKYLPLGYVLKQKGALLPLPSAARNFKLPEVPEIDWTLIIKLVFSLYVILIGFSAISGEKEQGTLKQILSNSVGRISVFVGKYIALLITTIVPLLIGLFVNLALVTLFMPREIIVLNISRILLMVFLILCYLSMFVFLCLFVSSLVIGRSSLVLLILLTIWITSVIIVPNLSGILSHSLSRASSEYQTAKMIGPLIQQQVWAKIYKIREKVRRAEVRTEKDLKKETDRAFEEGQEEINKYYKEYENAGKLRLVLAQNMSRVSPAALFQFAAESISQTGIKREESFLRDAKNYTDIYDRYVLKKVGALVGTSILSFSMDMTINGKTVIVSSPFPMEYQGDKSDFPQFVENKPPLGESIKDSLLDIAGLIIWNIILAVCGFRAFIRADVR